MCSIRIWSDYLVCSDFNPSENLRVETHIMDCSSSGFEKRVNVAEKFGPQMVAEHGEESVPR